LTCRRYEITYFVHSEIRKKFFEFVSLFIRKRFFEYCTHLFIRKFTRTSLNYIYQIYHNLSIFIFNFSSWHATLNQSNLEQLACLEALQIDEFLYYLSMFQLKLRTSRSHKTLRLKNNYVNDLLISRTRSSRC